MMAKYREKNTTYLCDDDGHQIMNGVINYSGNVLSKNNYHIDIRCNVIGCPGSIFNKKEGDDLEDGNE